MLSPRVNIYVGPESQHYSIPKDVLGYYSTYFDRCFNGTLKEAKEAKLVLAEDRAWCFAILVEYVLHGKIITDWDYFETLDECFAFIAYADKYDMGEAGMAVYKSLAFLLSNFCQGLKGEHIECVFRAVPKQHPLRDLVTKAALKGVFISQSYAKQERDVDGFLEEMMLQYRACVSAHPRFNISYAS
jgi:hypothetical protein